MRLRKALKAHDVWPYAKHSHRCIFGDTHLCVRFVSIINAQFASDSTYSSDSGRLIYAAMPFEERPAGGDVQCMTMSLLCVELWVVGCNEHSDMSAVQYVREQHQITLSHH